MPETEPIPFAGQDEAARLIEGEAERLALPPFPPAEEPTDSEGVHA